MLLFIDHYDSFSFNLIAWLRNSGVEVTHCYCDDSQKIANFLSKNTPIFISPGPKHPSDYAQTAEIVSKAYDKVPVFGVCLGHQIICSYFGGQIELGPEIQHGSKIRVRRAEEEVSEFFEVASYNSLRVKRGSIAEEAVTYRDEQGAIYGAQFTSPSGKVLTGVQFHPESFLSDPDLPWRYDVVNAIQRHHRINGSFG